MAPLIRVVRSSLLAAFENKFQIAGGTLKNRRVIGCIESCFCGAGSTVTPVEKVAVWAAGADGGLEPSNGKIVEKMISAKLLLPSQRLTCSYNTRSFGSVQRSDEFS